MPSKRQIPLTDIQEEVGVTISSEEMTNGEKRVRLASIDGNKIVVVEGAGAWQDSALMVRDDGKPIEGEEFVIVAEGWAAIATLDHKGIPLIRIYGKGSKFTIDPNRVHNTFVSTGGLLVAVITGHWGSVKRQPSPEFDKMTQTLSVQDIVMLGTGLA